MPSFLPFHTRYPCKHYKARPFYCQPDILFRKKRLKILRIYVFLPRSLYVIITEVCLQYVLEKDPLFGQSARLPPDQKEKFMYRKSHTVRAALCLLLTFVFVAACLPQTILAASDTKAAVSWPEAPENNSGAVCLLDSETGAILYDKNMDEQRYPASITKILTALLVIENKQMTDTVTFGEQAVSESIPGNARINVQLGETITIEDALHAILLASANEVCTQVAIDIAGSVEAFAAMMNERAAALGCTNTHFTNANGLPDPNHYTSAHDMALIMQECIKNETFCRIESDLTYTIQPTNMTAAPRDLQNHHAMLFQDGQWGYQGAFAGKTGYTDEAHNTLVTAAKRGNMTLICVVLTCDNLDYINDTRTVLDYGYNNFKNFTLKNTKKESLSGIVSLPKDAKIKAATYTDPDGAADSETYTRQYFYEDHFIGTAEVSPAGSSSDSSSVSSSSEPSENTGTADVPAPENKDQTSSLSTPLYILVGLNVVAFLILIIAAINNARKRRRRRKRHHNTKNRRR